MTLCQHYSCRCARAAELAVMSDRTGDLSLLADAVAVHDQDVACRLPEATQQSAEPST